MTPPPATTNDEPPQRLNRLPASPGGMEPVEAPVDWREHPVGTLREALGRFNVFRHESRSPQLANLGPFGRGDYGRVVLLTGRARIYFAQRTVETGPVSLLVSTLQVPYHWEQLDDTLSSDVCVFTPDFLEGFGRALDYPVLRPGGHHVYPLSAAQRQQVQGIFAAMSDELGSPYRHKYDLLKVRLLELVHVALKAEASSVLASGGMNGAQRVATLFMDLLERQFPLEHPGQTLRLKTPAAFAAALSVHVNHLNRSLQLVTGRTTRELIAHRMALEACKLLRHTTWTVAQVADVLGYSEPGHFTAFFRKHRGTTPTAYRLTPKV